MSTLKGTTMHPRCRHIGACWDLLECWFQLFSTSQNTSQIQFRTLLKKKNQISWFSWCSTREDLSIDVSITNVGLISTKLRWFQLFVKSQILNFKLFWKKFKFSGFPCCSTDIDDDDFFSRGTDRRTDRQTRFWNPHMETMSAHKKFQLKTQN